MIMNFAPRKSLRCFLAFTFFLGMLISAVSASISHLPVNAELAEQTRHAELAPDIDDHGHSHDDGEFEEQQANHTHGHNPADHTHDIPNLLSPLHSVSRDVTRIHFIDSSVSIELGAYDRLDGHQNLSL